MDFSKLRILTALGKNEVAEKFYDSLLTLNKRQRNKYYEHFFFSSGDKSLDKKKKKKQGEKPPFKCQKEVLSLQPMIPPKRFDIFP